MSKKFSPMRFTAATEEAAVEGALQLVGATRDEISYDFISETAKGVTVRIRPFEEADSADDEKTEAEAPVHLDSVDDFDDEDDEDSDKEDASETSDDELDFDADLELADDEYDEDEDDEEYSDDDDSENVDSEDLEAEEEPEIEVDAEMLERALGLARAMLDRMGLDAQVEAGRARTADIVPLSIEGEDVGILIGKHGATLQSFQYVMNLTLNNGDQNALRVSVDAGNYRARRQESLEAVARGTAHRVRRDGRPIKMEPMPSNERRIVHDFLKSEAGISTQSEGREPHRCVVVAPGASDYSGATDPRPYRGGRNMGGYSRGRGGRNRR